MSEARGARRWALPIFAASLFTLVLTGCSGSDGSDGQAGAPGVEGESGPTGETGRQGLGIKISDRHGKANALQATKGPNNPANLCSTITSASVNAEGKVVVDLDVRSSGGDQIPCTADDMPYVGLAANVMNFVIAQLRPSVDGDSSYWVSYINSAKTKATSVTGPGTAPDGTTMNQPSGEAATAGTWTDNGNGSYRYVTSKVLTGGITIAAAPKPGTYAYDPNLTHRVAAQMGDYDGAGPATHGANNPVYDFVPATGQKVADPREIVVKENCNACHGTLSFHGSNGQRLDTKLCVTCHNATAGDPESGNVLDFKVMLHKIHMGRHLPSVGYDFAGHTAGKYNSNPEAAVKGTPYIIWGYNNSKHEWSEVGFPANVANCTKCHQNATLADNWKTKPTKEACGSCHDGINFADGTGTRVGFPDSKVANLANTGDVLDTQYWVSGNASSGTWLPVTTGHAGGAVANNAECSVCHRPSGAQTQMDYVPAPVPAVHDMAAKNREDHLVEISMANLPGRGYYVKGETPVVRIVLKDPATGNAIDHSTVTNATYSNANFYVNGPRAKRVPAFTVAASGTANTAGNSLFPASNAKVAVAEGNGSIEYTLETVGNEASGTYSAFVNIKKTANTRGLMSWGLANFQVGTATAEKQIAVCTTCHENTVWHDNTKNGVPGNHPAPFNPDACGSCHDNKAQVYPKLGLLADGSNTKWKGGGVCVNTAGTTATTDDTLDASLVEQKDCLATENRKWMGTVCITGGGLDPTITATAACTTAGGTWTSYTANNMGFGAAPISRRVHGVHFAQKANGTPGVNYPFEIYNGHNVSVVFPQDVKNCETCHTAETTGTWSTKPSRVVCLACHDSDAAQAHATIMTVDPTPTADATGSQPGPYSGDEQESCSVCHN